MMCYYPFAKRGAARLLVVSLAGAALAASAVSCIYEKRTDCPAPFDFTVKAEDNLEGNHVFTLDVKPNEEGLILNVTGKVDGKDNDALKLDGIDIDAENPIVLTMPRRAKGKHTVSFRVMDSDFGVTKEVPLTVDGLKAEASFKSVPGGDLMAEISLLEGPGIEYASTYSLGSETLENAPETAVFGKGGKAVVRIPHQIPGEYSLKATYKAGEDEETFEFPFAVEEGELALEGSFEGSSAVLGLELVKGDFNTVWGLEFLVDGKPVKWTSGKESGEGKAAQVFLSGKVVRYSVPLPDASDHAVTVILSDGSWSRRYEVPVSVADMKVSLTISKSGNDTWTGTLHLDEGSADLQYMMTVSLDGKETVRKEVRFDANRNAAFTLGPVYVGKHTVKAGVSLSGKTADASATIDEDRLGVSLSFVQEQLGVHKSGSEWSALVHEKMTLSLTYGWKGSYSIEVSMSPAGENVSLKKVTKRTDEVSGSLKEVSLDTKANLASGKATVTLPGGKPAISGHPVNVNTVSVRLTPDADGAATKEFTGTFTVPTDKVNGFRVASEETVVKEGDAQNVTYHYLINGVPVKEVRSGEVVTDDGSFTSSWYGSNRPGITVANTGTCSFTADGSHNYFVCKGLKTGSTAVTVKKDAVTASLKVTVAKQDKFVPEMTVVRSGKDLWDITLTAKSGSPSGSYTVQGFLDGKAAPGFCLPNGSAIPASVSFDSNRQLKLRMGAIPIGRHTFTLTLNGTGGMNTLTADITEDRLGVALSFAQKVYGCHYGYYSGGVWRGEKDHYCVVHEDMTMAVDYGWKGRYAVEVFMKTASSDDAEKQVTTRRDEVRLSASIIQAKDVDFDKETDLSSGKGVLALPSGRPPLSGRTDRKNKVRIRLTPVWDGATTAEFKGEFEVPVDKVNGLWIAAGEKTQAEAGKDTWSDPSTNHGFSYMYAVNGITFKDVKSDGLVSAYGTMWVPYYVKNPPTLTMKDPSIAEARSEDTYNMINVRGLKEGTTELTIRKDYAIAIIKVTVVKTRSGGDDGFDVILSPMNQ